MSLRVKLVSAFAMMFLMIGILIVGIFAAQQQTLTMTGNVQFNINDRSLYVKQVRIKQDNSSAEPQVVSDFMPGYINGEFNMNIGEYDNSLGSFALYFDIINATDDEWEIKNVTLSEQLQSEQVSVTYSGIIETNDIAEKDDNGYKIFAPETTDIDGSLILVVTAPNSSSIDLSGITITIDEYIENPVLQVTSISSAGATVDTYSNLIGVKGIDSHIDLSDITFNIGETTLTISMTSLNENYIKNIVSYTAGAVDYNTTGTNETLFVHSTSLYLPQNPSGELTSGENKDLIIYVNNNTGSPTTVEGFQVSFEEKMSLIQADIENEYWYVEMGTIMGETQSEYVRWRYLASVDDSGGSDVATKYSTFNENMVPTGDGYFLLESNVLTPIGRDGTNNMVEVSFNNDYTWYEKVEAYHNLHGFVDIKANDYATSTVRQYINGRSGQLYYSQSYDDGNYIFSPDGRTSNMFYDLNIDTSNDIVYKKIVARRLGELYMDSGVDFPDLSSADEGYKYSEDDADEFWLLSDNEVKQLLGEDMSDYAWTTAQSYYLGRTPSDGDYEICFYRHSTIEMVIVECYSPCAARSAFKLSI